MAATFQQLQATICCPSGKCHAETHLRDGEPCAAYAYEDEAYAVLELLGVELAGRALKRGERP